MQTLQLVIKQSSDYPNAHAALVAIPPVEGAKLVTAETLAELAIALQWQAEHAHEALLTQAELRELESVAA